MNKKEAILSLAETLLEQGEKEAAKKVLASYLQTTQEEVTATPKSHGGDVLRDAAQRLGIHLDEPQYCNDVIEGAVATRISTFLSKVYEGKVKLTYRTIREGNIQDDDTQYYGYGDNEESVDYYVNIDYPEEVEGSVNLVLKPKLIAKEIYDALRYDLDLSSSELKALSQDKAVLKYAMRQALQYVTKFWEKEYDSSPSNYRLPHTLTKPVEDFVYENEESTMTSDPKLPEIVYTGDLDVDINRIQSRVTFVSPGKVKIAIIFDIDAEVEWPDAL